MLISLKSLDIIVLCSILKKINFVKKALISFYLPVNQVLILS